VAASVWGWSVAGLPGEAQSSGATGDERRAALALALVLLGLAVVGCLACTWLGRREDTRQRDRLLDAAHVVASAIDPEVVRRFGGRAPAADGPGYLRLKTQLRTLREAMPGTRFLYLMGMVDGQVVFLVDSEPPGSEDESPPGQMYAEASADLRALFSSRQGYVEGPYPDRWGTFLSGLVPLVDSRTEAVLAVVGVDTDAGSCLAATAQERLKALGLASLVAATALAFFGLRYRFRAAVSAVQAGRAAGWLLSWGPAVVVAHLGALLTVVAYWEARRSALDAFETGFRHQAASRGQALTRSMERPVRGLVALQSSIAADVEVTGEGLARSAAPLLAQGDLVAVAWARPLDDADRPAGERRPPGQEPVGVQVTELDSTGVPVPAARRDRYYPVLHAVPSPGADGATGYDLGSDPALLEALLKACDSGEPAASGLVRWLRATGEPGELAVFLPVYRGGAAPGTVAERRAALVGLVVGICRPGFACRTAVAGTTPLGLPFLLLDLAAPPDHRLLYRHTPRVGTVDWSRAQTGPRLDQPLVVAGRDWLLTIVPGTAFVAQHLRRGHRWILPIGLLVTGLLALYLHQVLTGRWQAEALVLARTTELAAQQDRLRSHLAFLGALLDAIPIPVYYKDRSGVYRGCNAAFARTLGRRPEEIVGRTVFDVAPHDLAERHHQQDLALLAQGGVQTYEGSVAPADGSRRDAIFHKATYATDANPVAGLVGTILDITERKRAEAARRALEVQLRQEQKLAAVGTLAHGVAHEINNPVFGIMNYAQLIGDRLDPASPLREYAGEIVRESERIVAIVRHLLSFAQQPGEGRRPANLAAIVRAVVAHVGQALRPEGVALTLDVPAYLPPVNCHARQIRQVLEGLLANAREALDERFPGPDPDKLIVVTARTCQGAVGDVRRPAAGSTPSAPEPGGADGPDIPAGMPPAEPPAGSVGWLRITVEDHGVGIRPDTADRLFDPFFTTKSRSLHAGLGLTLGQAIARDHGGDLTVECEPGRFTRFHLDLPTAPPDGQAGLPEPD
jgi:PAS domain S-box-containing protein